MNIESVLKHFAESVLHSINGPGCWELFRRKRFRLTESPLLGLKAGDIVWTYDVDNEKLISQAVAVVFDGVGYVASFDTWDGPQFRPVESDAYGITIAEAVQAYREDIESGIEVHRQRVESFEELKAILAEVAGEGEAMTDEPIVERKQECVWAWCPGYEKTVEIWDAHKIRRDLRAMPNIPARTRLKIYQRLEQEEAAYRSEVEAMQRDDERRSEQAAEMILTACIIGTMFLIASVAYLLWFE